MSDLMPFVVVGIVTGSIYAVAALGLVVTYKTSGVFNFAHGAVGMVGTIVFYEMREQWGLPTILSAVIVLGLVAPALGLAIDRLLLQRLEGSPAATYLVVALGLLVGLQGVAYATFGATTRRFEGYAPRTTAFTLAGVNVGWDQVVVVAITGCAGLGLVAFFKFTPLGLRMRAVVDDPRLVDLMGIDANRLRSMSWMLGTTLATLAGLLISPQLGLDATALTLLVLFSFGAAAVGRLENLALTYAGGLVIGVGAAISTKYAATTPALAGLPTSLPFIILFGVLVLSPRGSFVDAVKEDQRRRGNNRARGFPRLGLPALLAVCAVLPAVLSGSRLLTATTFLVFVLVFSSLGLLVGTARLLSLAHAVFVALGATTMDHLTSAGLPWPVALLVVGLVMAPVGAIVAIPALRLSGLFLALATFGFGVLAQDLLFNRGFAFGADGFALVPRPDGFATDLRYYYVVLLVVGLAVTVIEVAKAGRLGRFLRAMADSDAAVASLGVPHTSSRTIAFALSASLAAIAGALLGALTLSVNPATLNFFQSLLWVTVLVAAGATGLKGAVLASVLLHVVPAIFVSPTVTEWQPVAFGLAAIVFAQRPNGILGSLGNVDVSALASRSRWRLRAAPSNARMLPDGLAGSSAVAPSTGGPS